MRCKILDRRLSEKDRRGVFHCHGLGNRRGAHLVEPARERGRETRQRWFAYRGGLVPQLRKILFELGQILGAPSGQLQPQVLGRGEQLTRFAQQRLHAHHVGGQHFGARNQAGQSVRALNCLDLRPHRSADRNVIKHLSAHAVGDFGRTLDKASDLQVDAAAKLLDAKTAFNTLFDDALKQRSHRPPERALRGVGLNVLYALDCIAHLAGSLLVSMQPGKQPALVEPALLDQK